MVFSVLLLANIGFIISLYLYLLEQKVKRDPRYKPFCDISDRISCTKPMQSAYTSLFYLPNSVVAMLFYILIEVLAVFGPQIVLILAALIGCIGSCILGYVLYFKIKSLCLLCTSLYIINFFILFLSIAR